MRWRSSKRALSRHRNRPRNGRRKPVAELIAPTAGRTSIIGSWRSETGGTAASAVHLYRALGEPQPT